MAEVTEDMVTRALKAFYGERDKQPSLDDRFVRNDMRRTLNAALNPPVEPEIPVSEGMIDAARKTFWASADSFSYRADCKEMGFADLISSVYRAMETQRRKEQGHESPLSVACPSCGALGCCRDDQEFAPGTRLRASGNHEHRRTGEAATFIHSRKSDHSCGDRRRKDDK